MAIAFSSVGRHSNERAIATAATADRYNHPRAHFG